MKYRTKSLEIIDQLLEMIWPTTIKSRLIYSRQNIDDPIGLIELADCIVSHRHQKAGWPSVFCEKNNIWNVKNELKVNFIEEMEYEAFSLGSCRGRECAFYPAAFNGGMILKYRDHNILYDPGTHFHDVMILIAKEYGGLWSPKIGNVLVSHSHPDHAGGLSDVLTYATNFFSAKSELQLIAPPDVSAPIGYTKSKLDINYITTKHGPKQFYVTVYHYYVDDEFILISDGPIFDKLGSWNPSKENAPSRWWKKAVDSNDYVLNKTWKDFLSKGHKFKRAYITVQCSDILNGDFAKLSGSYFLARSDIADEIIFNGWGAENVVVSASGSRIVIPYLWGEAFELLGFSCTVLDDFKGIN